MHTWKSISALGLCACAGLLAQQVPAPPPDTLHMKIMSDDAMKLSAESAAGAGNMTVRVLSAEFGVSGKVVKGLPYQATAVTETTQQLADGNRIVHKSTALLARDSEGRTRREQKIDTVGQWSTGDQPPPLVFINDPVAQANYVLEPNTKTARKMDLNGQKSAAEAKAIAEGKASEYRIAGKGEIAKEALGSKMVEGTMAEGTRFTRTVPAGALGNERPLTYVNETWISSELGVLVMSRHTDPQMGETVYTLTNIQRAEPDVSLFRVPGDYTVKEGPHVLLDMKRDN